MRKLLFALLLTIATPAIVNTPVQASTVAASGNGIKIPASQVPKAVRKSFKLSFPTATQVEWEYNPQYYGGNIYTASFRLNGQRWEASFNESGTLLSSGPKG